MPRNLAIEIRDRRLKGGRIRLSAGTDNRKLRNARKASLQKLLERGDVEVIEALRIRRVHISEVDAAVREGRYDLLKQRALSAGGTLKDALARAMTRVERTTERQGTVNQYQVMRRALLAHFTDERAIDSITQADAESFIHRNGWTAQTKRQATFVCGRMWRLAGVPAEVWKGIELARPEKGRPRFLQPAQLARLMKSNSGTPRAVLCALGALAGLRIGEVANLRIGTDVDTERRILRIQARAGRYPWRPKRDRSTRDVPISDELLPVIEEHIRLGFAGETYLIVLPGQDAPVHVNVLGRWTRRALEAAGIDYGRKIEGLTFHSFRHTFASWLAQDDVQLLKIARLLGDTIEVVADTYAHLLPQDLERAVTLLDARFRKATDADYPQEPPQ